MKKNKEAKQLETQQPIKPLSKHPSDKKLRDENVEPISEENIDRIPDEENIYEEDGKLPPEPGEGP
jgi:hypothetical protein